MSKASFVFKKLSFPRIEGTFVSAPHSNDFETALRAEILIVSSRDLRILFGTRVQSVEQLSNNEPVARCIVEAIGDFELGDDLINPIKDWANDIKYFPQMLGIIYPFLREKVASFFGSNEIGILLPPLNIYDQLKDSTFSQAISVTDAREQSVQDT